MPAKKSIKNFYKKSPYRIGDIFTRRLYPKSAIELWLCTNIEYSDILADYIYVFELQNEDINPSTINVWKLGKESIGALIETKPGFIYYHVIQNICGK